MSVGLQGTFLKGTLIHTPLGNTPIEKCSIIYTIDKFGNKLVSDCGVYDAGFKQEYEIHIDEEVLRCSPEHKFPVYNIESDSIHEVQSKHLNKNIHFIIKYENIQKISVEKRIRILEGIRRTRSAWNKKHFLEKTRHREDKEIVYDKEMECFKDSIRDEDDTSHDNISFEFNEPETRFQRTYVERKNSTDKITKTQIQEISRLLYKWTEYREYEEKKNLPINSKESFSMVLSDMQQERRNMQFSRLIDSSYRFKSSKQQTRKSDDIMCFMPFKITHVIKTEKKTEMFDLIVPDYHVYILSNNIVSHNSAKTSTCVREMLMNPHMTYFSNIVTKGIPNNIVISPDMIAKKEVVQVKKNGEVVYKFTVNREFWEEASKKYKCLNVILDEAHSILNARRGMLKKTQVILDWIALLRRVLGSTEAGYGKLTLITQVERRLDIVAKEQTTKTTFHLCHYVKYCPKCGFNMQENNEIPDPIFTCPICERYGKKVYMKKTNFLVEVWDFQDYNSFIMWKYLGKGKTYYKHYYITDIEKVFPLYNTLQWDNLISET